MKIDIPLGVPFRFDDHEVVAVTTYTSDCYGCFMKKHSDLTLSCHCIACMGEQRKDKQDVIFVEIVKGGEDVFKIPVGAVVWINDVLVKCVQDETDSEGCQKCVFSDVHCSEIYCTARFRPDGLRVHFEKVEEKNKGGE